MNMKSADMKKLRAKLEKKLDAHRYEHTLGVAYTAACLATLYGVDVTKAELAGLLHDCAKCMTNEERIELCNKHRLPISEAEKENPFLLHAKAGAFLASYKYDIQDEDILNAIRYHTTGRPGMSVLEKIIYVADYMEPGRKQAPNLLRIRQTAFKNLDEALLMILEDTLQYLHSVQHVADPMTQTTYDYYHLEAEERRPKKQEDNDHVRDNA